MGSSYPDKKTCTLVDISLEFELDVFCKQAKHC